ncbi:DHHC palmitoyltransferase-domain-containing protein [Panaeolus papilionaceus]|nr:DHHC palmitoyltransferase-domain-containing protein [Panaeolus papilionaceus]
MANAASDARSPRDKEKSPGTTCCGVVQEAKQASRERRANRRTAQPWIVRKLMVAITAGIMAYAAYVYIAHLCLPMIKRRSNAAATRGVGIALLSVFSVLYLWMWWAYVKVVLTSPGYARDYVGQQERPLIPSAPNPIFDPTYAAPLDSVTLDHESESHPRNSSQHAKRPSYSATSTSHNQTNLAGGPSYEDLLRREGLAAHSASVAAQPGSPSTVNNAVSSLPNSVNVPAPNTLAMGDPSIVSSPIPHASELPPPVTAKLSRFKKSKSVESKPGNVATSHPPAPPSAAQPLSPKERKRLDREAQLLNLNVVRRPPMLPYLLPAHRYCDRDFIVKPYRAHHCRACGTCVLKYDHHCPWIGQCVGARNHKFFLNFCQATAVFTSFVFATLLVYTIKGLNSPSIRDADPQQIVIIALAGLFLLFTSSLTVSHVHLILQGQTTVEAIPIRMMQEREKKTLARGFKFYEWGAKRRKVKEWDEEWGDLHKEGNLWWKGSAHAEWVDVMGKNWLGWFLPVGRPLSDGTHYPPNPRYDSEGRWRRRSEWPAELR